MDEWAPRGIDVTTPNVARMYDFWLGGKDNYAADRKVAEQVLELAPEARFMARQNRAFVTRAVRHLVGELGIRQLLDIGAGLPTRRNVHEVALEQAPDARIVYADYDPVVVTHAKALLRTSERVRVIQADVRRPVDMLEKAVDQGRLDLSLPVAVLITAVFHFIPDSEDPRGILRAYHEAMAPGSHLVLSHSCLESGPEAAAKITELYKNATAPAVLRTKAEIGGLFEGFELIDPGLVYTPEWRPDGSPVELPAHMAWMLGGVGRRKGAD